MNSTLGKIGWGLFIAACIVIIFLRSCNTTKTNTITKTIKGDSVFTKGKTDTLYKDAQLVYVQKPGLTHEVVKHDTVYIPAKPLTHADTLNAAAHFFITSIYKDTLTGREVIVSVRDSIGQNKILGRTFSIKNTRAIQIVTPAKGKLFVGGQIGLSTTLKSGLVMPSIMYETKYDAVYNVSYDILSKTPTVGMYWKIHFGK